MQTTYCALTALSTLAASFIWGINTLFLLDAGLSNSQAFAANAFFTLGQVIFEIPTGVIADTWGRRTSFLLGSATLAVTTLLYLWLWQAHAPFFLWATVSAALGLGFTFFSGAVEAWLVDALDATGFTGKVDDVFAKGQIWSGGAMLIGSTLGGYIAQAANLGVPYIIRCVVLVISFLAAWVFMRDLGFAPRKPESIAKEVRSILKSSWQGGWQNTSVRWMMLTGPFMAGVGFYGFYAAQPLLLELYGDKQAYGVAGLIAALVAGAQIAGGFAVPLLRKLWPKRSSILIAIILTSVVLLLGVGFIRDFAVVLVLLGFWGLLGSALMPVRRAYLNELIPSAQRATILSFDGLLSSLGGAVLQPGLGRAADVWGYSASFVIAGALQIFALPFALLVRRGKTDIAATSAG